MSRSAGAIGISAVTDRRVGERRWRFARTRSPDARGPTRAAPVDGRDPRLLSATVPTVFGVRPVSASRAYTRFQRVRFTNHILHNR
jgi:hypothetical protein